MPPIRAQKDLRRAADLGDFDACLADTGGFKVPPVCVLYEARPLAFKPPAGFLPSLRVHAAVLAMCSFVLVLAWVTVRPSGFLPVGQRFPSPLPTLPPVRYLAESGQPITHSGVTVIPKGDETKRRVNTHSTATRVFKLVMHRSAGACAKLETCLC